MKTAVIILQEHVPTSVHPAADEFVKLDPFGIGMTIIAMIIVFLVLAIVYITFKFFSRLYNMDFKKKTTTRYETEKAVVKADVQADVSAAIAMAIHLYTSQQHNIDSLTLTIDSVSRRYSPWSSKIYTLRQLPR